MNSNRLPILAAEINRAHAQARAAARTSLKRAIEAGDRLLEAKAVIGHGGWLEWLAANVSFSERTAQTYMRLASKKPELKSAATADLTIEGAVEAIAGRTAPPARPRMMMLTDSEWTELDARITLRGEKGVDFILVDPCPGPFGFYYVTHYFTPLEGAHDDDTPPVCEYFRRPVRADFVHTIIDRLAPKDFCGLADWYAPTRDELLSLTLMAGGTFRLPETDILRMSR